MSALRRHSGESRNPSWKKWTPAFAGVTMFVTVIFLSSCAGSKSHLKLGKTDEGEVVEAEGLAPDNPQDRLGVKKASLTDAQRNAVEKAVGVFVSARTFVEKAVAIENNILARTEGYVKKYDVLKEGPDGGFYKTKIRALVALKDLEADLKSFSLMNQSELTRPRLSLSLTETVDQKPVSESPAQSALEKALMQQGFVIVGSSRAQTADVAVTGTASAFPFQTDKLGGFVSYRTRITLEARRPGSSDKIYSGSKEASGLGGNAALAGLKSLETAGDFAAGELGAKLLETWGKNKVLLIMVEGVPSFAEVSSVKKHLSSEPGVTDVQLRLFDEGMAQFDVLLGSVSPSDLAARLATSQSFPLTILESSNSVVRFKLK